jgi:hypothetical protein
MAALFRDVVTMADDMGQGCAICDGRTSQLPD